MGKMKFILILLQWNFDIKAEQWNDRAGAFTLSMVFPV
jgi:hypothetical protein